MILYNVSARRLPRRRRVQGRLDRAGEEAATEHSADGEGNLYDHAELEKHSGQDRRCFNCFIMILMHFKHPINATNIPYHFTLNSNALLAVSLSTG